MTITEKCIYRLVEDDNPSQKYSSIKKNVPVVSVALLLVALILIGFFYFFWVLNIFASKTNEQILDKQFPSATYEHFDHEKLQVDAVTAAIKNIAIDTDESKLSTENVAIIGTNPVFTKHKICSHKLIPGLERMKRGIDITTLDLFPAEKLLHSTNGFQRPLFEFTCDLNHTWFHPKSFKNLYALPDQISFISLLPSGGKNVQARIYSNLHDYKRALALSFGYGAGADLSALGIDIAGGWSLSPGYQDTLKQILKSNVSVAEVSAHVGAFQIDFDSSRNMRLSAEAREFIHEKFPTTYEEDTDIYGEFVSTFGTHYFESAIFGGCLYQKSLIDNEYVYSSTERELEANLKMSFKLFKLVNTDSNLKGSFDTNEVDEQFQKHSQASFQYYGGFSDFSNKGTDQNEFVSHWMNTVIENPWLFSGKLVPIERLIEDSNIRNQVRKASIIKRTKAYVKDIRSILKLANPKLTTLQMDTLNSIERYLNSKHETKDSSKISLFVKQIDQLFVSLQQMRNRALLEEHSTKLNDTEAILHCKLFLTVTCNAMLYRDIEREFNQFKASQERIQRFLITANLDDNNSVQSIIRKIAKIVTFHSTKINICTLNDYKCNKCFGETVRIFMACRNPKAIALIHK